MHIFNHNKKHPTDNVYLGHIYIMRQKYDNQWFQGLKYGFDVISQQRTELAFIVHLPQVVDIKCMTWMSSLNDL